MYVNTLAYWNATLFPKFEAIGEELLEIVSGSTASQPDIDFRHMYEHSQIRMQGCFKISNQSVK
jgi:hypothetical protein